MKKNIALVTIFIFIFTLALNLPVQAEEEVTVSIPEPTLYTETTSSTPETISTPEIATTTSPELIVEPISAVIDTTNVPLLKIEPRKEAPAPKNDNSSNTKIQEMIKSKGLEKIPSLDQIKNFRDIIKDGNSLFGIKIATQAKNKGEDSPVKEESKTSAKIAAGLEKIPSPEKMNLFEKIVKIGNVLFGVKKDTAVTTDTTKKEVATITSQVKAGLEKISGPDQIKNFKNIVKDGNSLFGIRVSGTNVARTLPAMSTETISCLSTAIDAKDVAVASILTKSASDINLAITARGTCQKAALAQTGVDRQKAVMACNEAFQKSSKATHGEAKKSQDAVWKQYKEASKTCSTKNTESSAEIIIEDGGQAMTEILNQ